MLGVSFKIIGKMLISYLYTKAYPTLVFNKCICLGFSIGLDPFSICGYQNSGHLSLCCGAFEFSE